MLLLLFSSTVEAAVSCFFFEVDNSFTLMCVPPESWPVFTTVNCYNSYCISTVAQQHYIAHYVC